MATKRNYKEFYVLLKRMPHADKEEMVLSHTGGRTSSIREMSDGEYVSLMRSMRGMSEQKEKLREARSSALRQLQLYGIDTTNWSAINRFVEQPRIAGKVFARLSIDELKALTSKMRAIQDKKRRKDHQEGSKQLEDSLKREAWSKQNTPS